MDHGKYTGKLHKNFEFVLEKFDLSNQEDFFSCFKVCERRCLELKLLDPFCGDVCGFTEVVYKQGNCDNMTAGMFLPSCVW